MTEPVIKSSIFDGLAQFVASKKMALDLAKLLDEAKLDRDLLTRNLSGPDGQTYIPLNNVSRFFTLAALRSGHPCFGLEYSQHYPVGASGSLGFLMVNAPSMRVAVENLVKYVKSFTHPMQIELVDAQDGLAYVEWRFPLEYTAAMPQYVSFAVGAVVKRLREIAGPAWTPLKVELIHRPLPCTALYTDILGSRVMFEAPKNRMWLDPSSLAKKAPSPNERLYKTLVQAGESELSNIPLSADLGFKQTPEAIRMRLRDYLQAEVAKGTPELTASATHLAIEPRQLQYMLETLSTSFSEEVSDVRKLIAEQLLVATDQSMTEIAAAIGFSELSSFTRASRQQWFGMSPRKFRQRMREHPEIVPSRNQLN